MQASLAGSAGSERPAPSPSAVKTGAIPKKAAGRAVDTKAIRALQRSPATASSSGQQQDPVKGASPAQRLVSTCSVHHYLKFEHMAMPFNTSN